MAAAIRDKLGIEADLVKGDNGIFDVEVDGRNIFSKHEVGRFPENDEVLALLKR